jgi:hypothetical protein
VIDSVRTVPLVPVVLSVTEPTISFPLEALVESSVVTSTLSVVSVWLLVPFTRVVVPSSPELPAYVPTTLFPLRSLELVVVLVSLSDTTSPWFVSSSRSPTSLVLLLVSE